MREIDRDYDSFMDRFKGELEEFNTLPLEEKLNFLCLSCLKLGDICGQHENDIKRLKHDMEMLKYKMTGE